VHRAQDGARSNGYFPQVLFYVLWKFDAKNRGDENPDAIKTLHLPVTLV
jgi:hypothetical protein